jgi:pSer/pThr/pTyr-binding forkhead associated (FHA) protein
MTPSHDHALAESLRLLLERADDYEGRARGTDLYRPQLLLAELHITPPTDAGGALVEPHPDHEAHPHACSGCGAHNPPTARFCGDCGLPQRPPVAPVTLPSAPLSRFRLLQLRDDGSDGTSTPLPLDALVIGREADLAFPADPLLSPRHAKLTASDEALRIEDLQSLNGTFLKLRNEHRLQLGDTLILGRQLLRFERVEQTADPRARDADGTRHLGSPSPGAAFRLVQIGVGGVAQNAYLLYDTATSIGRERGDLVFPRDRFMSGKHAEVVARSDGHYYLIDKGSSNGTWLKLWESTELALGDRILVGQQTFRVEAS